MISIANGSCQYVTSFTTGSLWILVFWECSCNIKSNDVRPKTWLYFLFSKPLVCSHIHEADIASVKGWEWGQVREGCKEDLHIFRRNLRANKFAGNTRAHPEIHEISLRRVIKKHERSRKKKKIRFLIPRIVPTGPLLKANYQVYWYFIWKNILLFWIHGLSHTYSERTAFTPHNFGEHCSS